MISPAVLWPSVLGLTFLTVGTWTYRRDVVADLPNGLGRIVALSPVFIAAPLATFAGEHFTVAASLAELVPRWMPARLFVAYFVGVALFSAALSLVARRHVRWSGLGLWLMFTLFVLLLYLPAAIERPSRMSWIFPFREGTFAMGGLALFATEIQKRRPKLALQLSTVSRIWAGIAIIYYGIEHLLYPQYSPGVPDSKLTASWVLFPHVIAYLTGALLVAFGAGMLIRKYALFAGAFAGSFMMLLTLVLYVPELFRARTVPQGVEAINFVADTLLFAGTLLAIARAMPGEDGSPVAITQSAS